MTFKSIVISELKLTNFPYNTHTDNVAHFYEALDASHTLLGYSLKHHNYDRCNLLTSLTAV